MIQRLALALLTILPVPAMADDLPFIEASFQRCLAAEPLTREAREGFPQLIAAPTIPCTNFVMQTCKRTESETACMSHFADLIDGDVGLRIEGLEAQGATATPKGQRLLRLIDVAKGRCTADDKVSKPDECRFFDAADDLSRLAELAALSGRQVWRDLDPPVITSDFPVRSMRACLDEVGIGPRDEQPAFGPLPSARADNACLVMARDICLFSGDISDCAGQLETEARRELASLPASDSGNEPEFCQDHGQVSSSKAGLFLDLLCRRAAARLKDGDL